MIRAGGGSIRFGKGAGVDAAALVQLVANDPERYSLDGPYRLRFKLTPPVADDRRLERIERLLLKLGASPPDEARAA